MSPFPHAVQLKRPLTPCIVHFLVCKSRQHPPLARELSSRAWRVCSRHFAHNKPSMFVKLNLDAQVMSMSYAVARLHSDEPLIIA